MRITTSCRRGLLVLACLMTAACAQPMTLSHSVDSMTVTPGNSVSCNATGIHVDNSYWRRYDLTDPAWGLSGPILIEGVSYGVEEALAGGGGMQPCEIRLYVNPVFPSTLGGPASTPPCVGIAGVAPDFCVGFNVADTTGVVLLEAVSPPLLVDPATDTVVVEFFTPDGTAAMNTFFIGSNTAGQTDPSYFSAALCAITDPLDLATIGFANMHMILDLVVSPQPPTCTLTVPMTCVTDPVTLTVDAVNAAMPGDMTIGVEWSTDAGMTFNPATMTVASPNPNPAVMAPPGMHDFEWDARADGVGSSGCEMVDIRIMVTDLLSGANGTCTDTMQVDTSALCTGICGDCDLNGAGPDILDALLSAQIAVALVVPSPEQQGCCDVNASTVIDIIDSLLMAQIAAGLPGMVMCP